MSDTTNKTPGQVAYWAWFKTKHTPGNPMALWEKVYAAVLAHASALAEANRIAGGGA